MQYTQNNNFPYTDAGTVWTKDGSFYWPDPTQVRLWNGTDYVASEETAVADLPDLFHWNSEYVENNASEFTVV